VTVAVLTPSATSDDLSVTDTNLVAGPGTIMTDVVSPVKPVPDTVIVLNPIKVVLLNDIVATPLEHGIVCGDTEPSNQVDGPVMLNVTLFR
jgi:hypothetical protein